GGRPAVGGGGTARRRARGRRQDRGWPAPARPARRRTRRRRAACQRGARRGGPRRRLARGVAVHVVATAGHVDHGKSMLVRALTGQGLPELTAALGRLTARLPRPDPRGAIRLWLDRVFAIKGSGTVVTGTLQAGTVQPGDELTVAPAMRTVRIRGVQSLGAPAAQAGGVARVALNLRGVSTRELGRGMALIQPGRWTVTSVIDVRLAP